MLTHFSLFTGIGGIDIAAEMAGFKSIGQVEINPFSLKILNKRYPDVPKWQNIKHLTRRKVLKRLYKEGLLYDRNDPINLLSGGFPCQDLSVAGKQAGLGGARSGLWFDMLDDISELRPRWVLAENVRGAVNLALDTVQMGMEGEGYKVWPYVIPASTVGAPHKRERLFVAGCREDVVDAICRGWGQEWIKGMGREMEERRNPSDMSPEVENAGACSGGMICGAMWRTPLATAVKLCPTPRANSHACPGIHGQGGFDLQTSVKLWPTPAAQDGKNSTLSPSQKERDTIPGAVIKQGHEGQLNPDWVECLQGFPIGWTDIDKEEINHDACKRSSLKILQILRGEIGTEEIQREAGRLRCVYAEKLLQSSMCREVKYERNIDEIGNIETYCPFARHLLRNMQNNQKSSKSPFGWETEQQRTGEPYDIMYFLSHEMALGTRQAYCQNGLIWPGWPAPMGAKMRRTPIESDSANRKLFVDSRGEPMLSGQVKMWATPSAWDCQGTKGGGQNRSLRTDIYNIKAGLTEAGQFPYEPPRVAKGIKNRADRIKSLGNAVVPWQVLSLIQAIYYIESRLN